MRCCEHNVCHYAIRVKRSSSPILCKQNQGKDQVRSKRKIPLTRITNRPTCIKQNTEETIIFLDFFAVWCKNFRIKVTYIETFNEGRQLED